MTWNPQSKSILEQTYQILLDSLIIFDLEGISINLEELDQFEEYLASVLYTIRSLYHQLHGHIPT